MTKYKNLSGNSNVDSYEYTSDTFTVKFNDGSHYLYSTKQNRNSLSEIQKMQQKGDAGIGLGTMLATKPHHPYDRKW